MEIKEQILSLKAALNQHNINYYVYDNPTISDFEYDALLNQLEKLELKHPQYLTKDSPTQRVGGVALKEFKSVEHRLPMLSLANAMNHKELEDFDKQIKKLLNNNEEIEYAAEPKLDGLAVELVYEKGSFIYGSTRGDGLTGEDITHNLKTLKSIPLSIENSTIPDLLEIRGEVFINKNEFKLLNKQRLEKGQTLFANPRNCAAGSLRQLDPKIANERPLQIFCYAPGTISNMNIKSQKDFLELLPKWGFPVNPHIKFGKGLSFIKKYYLDAENLRQELPYEIDGVVFKVNSYEKQLSLGERSKSPRWAIAGKLKAQQVTTKINDIIISVGRTGALTPVAQLEPILISGVTISNATLHNQDEINRKDIRINDTVLVQRAGDVIPEVVKVIKEKRPKSSTKFFIPTLCPICNGNVVRNKNEAVHRCINEVCLAKIKGEIEHFVSKNCMNIEGLGEKIIEMLVKNNLINNFSDIFYLDKEKLLKLDRMAELSTNNLLQSINQSKKTSLAKFIHSLGIRNVGQNASKVLELNFHGDINLLMDASENQLININEIGPTMANSILVYFNKSNNIEKINRCIEAGVVFKKPKDIKITNITNKTFVCTGSLKNYSRNKVKEIIELFGAKLSSSISSKTDYLIIGNNPGNKLEKAKKLNITILNESEFSKLLNSP